MSNPAQELDTKRKGEATVNTEDAKVTTGEATATAREASGPSPGPTATEALVIPQAGAEVTLSFKDMNPFPPLSLIMKRRNNVATLFLSGMQKIILVPSDRARSSAL